MSTAGDHLRWFARTRGVGDDYPYPPPQPCKLGVCKAGRAPPPLLPLLLAASMFLG